MIQPAKNFNELIAEKYRQVRPFYFHSGLYPFQDTALTQIHYTLPLLSIHPVASIQHIQGRIDGDRIHIWT